MKVNMKGAWKHLAALAIFVILTLVYFGPSVFNGKTLIQGDMVKYDGMSKEVKDYAETQESKDFPVISWTGSMFSGMPSYTASVPKAPRNFFTYLEAPVKALDERGASILLVTLISFYILMCVMKVNFWLALAGAIAYTFASYNIIIIGAGHISKCYVIAYMPLTIAGMLLVFKEKWIPGAVLTLLGVTLSLQNKHIQVTYYLAILCLILFLGYMVNEFRNKNYILPAKAAGLFVLCIIFAVLPTVGNLYSNYEMGKESIRGTTELTEKTTGTKEKVSSGLDIDYAFAWSYSIPETMTLLIPDFYGGVSGTELGPKSELYKQMKAHRMQTGKTVQAPAYWGDQPFTSGPVYFGALVCFLFLLGMMVIKNPIKWWILGATIFFVFLSWGKNFAFLNEFLFHYLPMYNKFRTPSMALVIPGLTFPIIAIWGLKLILNGEVAKNKLTQSLYWSLGVTGGLCLIFWLIPGAFLDFRSVNDTQFLGQVPNWWYDALVQDRKSLVQSDSFRSLAFIVLGAALIFWYTRSKNPAKTAGYVTMGIALLIFVDLWTVDKRYINYDSFVSQKSANIFKKTPADRIILEDKDPSYRVFNISQGDPFAETYTSYYHKSIGGYNGAKLRRYQELIDYRLKNEMGLLINALQRVETYDDLMAMNVFDRTPTLNMLNTRYIIYNPEQPPIFNQQAYGNAWFVDDFRIVENADEELAALNHINPQETAVIDRRFADQVNGKHFVKDENGQIEMTSYEPMRVRYKSSATQDQLAVFSEIYYPYQWEATIDGVPASHFRTDWLLRGMIIPAGEHEIEFRFVPQAYITAARIGSVSSAVIIVLIVVALGGYFYNRRKKATAEKE